MENESLIIAMKVIGGAAGLLLAFVIFIGFIAAVVELCGWLKQQGMIILDAVFNWVSEFLFHVLKSPFELALWFLLMFWIALTKTTLTIRAWAKGKKIRAQKQRDLRAYYLKYRAHFKNWRHFKRWVRDQENEEAQGSQDTQGKQDAYEEALELLGLDKGFTKEEFKTAYRRISGYVHPDKGCPTDYFSKKVNEAISLVKQRRNWK